jgi:hypothetical protein
MEVKLPQEQIDAMNKLTAALNRNSDSADKLAATMQSQMLGVVGSVPGNAGQSKQ